MTSDKADIRRRVIGDPVNFLAFGLGSGLSPVAPGTAGSVVGLALAWVTVELPIAARLLVGFALIVSGIWICGESIR